MALILTAVCSLQNLQIRLSLKSGARISCLHLMDLRVISSALGYPLALVLLSLSSCPQQVCRGRLAGPAVKAVFGNSLNQESPEGRWAEFNLPDILFGLHTIFRKF